MIVSLDLSNRIKKTKDDITAERDAVLWEGFAYDGIMYPCDPVFQDAVKTYLTAYLLGMMPHENPVRIRRFDNSFWYPNYAQLLPFAGALMQYVESIWTAYWTAKDSL